MLFCGLMLKIKLLFFQIVFIPDKNDREFLVGKAFGFIQPLFYVLERVLVCDIIHQNGTDGTPVIRTGNGLEYLLACLFYYKIVYSIPDLKFNFVIVDIDAF